MRRTKTNRLLIVVTLAALGFSACGRDAPGEASRVLPEATSTPKAATTTPTPSLADEPAATPTRDDRAGAIYASAIIAELKSHDGPDEPLYVSPESWDGNAKQPISEPVKEGIRYQLSRAGREAQISDRPDESQGVLIEVGPINEREAEVHVRVYTTYNETNGHAQTYVLQQKDGSWVVTSTKDESFS